MGAPATRPEATIAAVLAAAGLSLTLGSNLFSGPEQIGNDTGIPAAAVFVVTYGGAAPEPYLGTATDLREFAAQVTVRAASGDFDGASSTAWAVWQAIQRKTTSLPAGYIDLRCAQSAPIYLGLNGADQPRYSINVLLRYEG